MSRARDESAVIDVLPALFTIVEVDALPAWLVALAADVDETAVRRAVREPVPVGDHARVQRRPDGWLAVDGLRDPAEVAPGHRVDIVERVLPGVLVQLDEAVTTLRTRGATDADGPGGTDTGRGPADAARWVRDHRDCALAVADAANATGHASQSASVTTLLWQAVDEADFDAGFVRALTDVGGHAAVTLRDPRVLTTLLRSAWRWFERHGDLRAAEEYSLREWDLWRRAGRIDEAAGLLWWRADMSRRRGRPDLELHCYEQLEALHDHPEGPDRVALVRVRAATAAALLDYNRPELAVQWVRRAENTVRVLHDFPPVEQALVLEWSGRALWATGAVGPARRRFSDALALLVDVDEAAADHVRGLLAHDQDRPLPPPVPNRYPAPVPPLNRGSTTRGSSG